MKICKARRYNAGYPTKEETLINPEILKNMPERWKGLLVSGTLFSSVLLASCDPRTLFNRTVPVVLAGDAYVTLTFAEDEGVEIIIDEFLAQGIEFEHAYRVKVNAELPVDVEYEEEFEYHTLKAELEVDGMSKDGTIYFEFVSHHDFSKWTDDKVLIDDYFTRGEFLKEFFEDGMFETENGEIVAAFYNTQGFDYGSMEEELRQQVRDFIKMMEEQGIL